MRTLTTEKILRIARAIHTDVHHFGGEYAIAEETACKGLSAKQCDKVRAEYDNLCAKDEAAK